MPDNDYNILWDVSDLDWREIERRFKDKIPNDDVRRINRHLNINFPIFTLLINLNKRVKDLKFELEELKLTQKTGVGK